MNQLLEMAAMARRRELEAELAELPVRRPRRSRVRGHSVRFWRGVAQWAAARAARAEASLAEPRQSS